MPHSPMQSPRTTSTLPASSSHSSSFFRRVSERLDLQSFPVHTRHSGSEYSALVRRTCWERRTAFGQGHVSPRGHPEQPSTCKECSVVEPSPTLLGLLVLSKKKGVDKVRLPHAIRLHLWRLCGVNAPTEAVHADKNAKNIRIKANSFMKGMLMSVVRRERTILRAALLTFSSLTLPPSIYLHRRFHAPNKIT